MNRCFSLHAGLCVILLLLLVLPVLGHVPLTAGENTGLDAATVIDQPEKSFVIYGHLHEPGDVAYYRFDMSAGQKLHASLMTSGKGAPVPDLIIMGPSLLSFGIPPASLIVPHDTGVIVINGRPPQVPGYEPFTPSATFEVASYSMPVQATGTYYVAVHTSGGEQGYSLAPGFKEEFSATEWLFVPVNVIGIHVWEGQSPFVVLAPCIALVLLGGALQLWQQKRRGIHRSLFSWCAILAGLLYLGGATITLTQMVRALSLTGFSPSCMITLIFAAIPIALGVWALRAGMRASHPLPVSARISMGVIGLLGLLFWAGLIVGPVIAFVAAIVPAGTQQGP